MEYQDKTKEAQNSINIKIKYVYKKIKEKNKNKKNIKNILVTIKEIYYEKNNIFFCCGNTTHMINFLTEYNTEKKEKDEQTTIQINILFIFNLYYNEI